MSDIIIPYYAEKFTDDDEVKDLYALIEAHKKGELSEKDREKFEETLAGLAGDISRETPEDKCPPECLSQVHKLLDLILEYSKAAQDPRAKISYYLTITRFLLRMYEIPFPKEESDKFLKLCKKCFEDAISGASTLGKCDPLLLKTARQYGDFVIHGNDDPKPTIDYLKKIYKEAEEAFKDFKGTDDEKEEIQLLLSKLNDTIDF